MVHAPFALLPMLFPESYWRQACELAPIFNELVDRVSLDGKFLQDSLSRYSFPVSDDSNSSNMLMFMDVNFCISS